MSEIIDAAAHLYVMVWLIAAVTAHYAKLPLAKTIQAEMRPLYLPAVVAAYWLSGDTFDAWRLISLACGIANYWLFKDDDDDRWKRRRKKLTEKITRQGSRLVVAPVGAA